MSSLATKILTAEEFFEWAQQPANRHRQFELERGEVIEMPPAGRYHGFVCANIAGVLRNFAIQQGRGYVCTNDAGVIVERDPDTVRGPDVTFYEDAETADDMERQYAAAPPVLAVEALSPHDRINVTMRRVTQLLGRGVAMVWVVDPEARDISICRPDIEPELFTEEGSVSGHDVLVGFQCAAAEFFAVPGKPNR